MTFELHIWVSHFLVWKPVFGAHLMGFWKLWLILVLHFMHFLGLDWRIDVWGWKPKCFHWKMHKLLAKKKKISSLEEPSRVQPGREDEQCMMTSSWHHNFFFGCLGILGIIMHLLNLVLLEQLLLLLFFMV